MKLAPCSISFAKGVLIRRAAFAFAFIFMVFTFGSARAVEVAGLYNAELSVSGSTVSERTRLTQQGLREVLVKVSGGDQSLDHVFVEDALRNADKYLKQFSYLKINKEEIDKALGETQLLRLQFDQILVDSLLRRARMPIWGKNRPNLLVWVTIDDGQSRHILSAGEDSPLKQTILAVAKQRGIPVLFPLMDLEDEMSLSTVEAWGLFRDPLLNASARYQPEAILAGRLYQNAEQEWTGRWQLLFDGKTQGISASAPDLESYPKSGIDYAADLLAEHYAVNNAAIFDESVRFEIKGINSLAAYAEALIYMNDLAAVMDVVTSEVSEDSLILTLTTKGQVEKLIEAIALDHVLILRQVPIQASDEPTLYYTWNKK